MNKNMGILLFLVGVVLMGSLVLGANIKEQVQGGSLTKGVVTRQNASAVGTDTAAAGNVTNLNISVAATTGKWQGYYGNASLSSLKLGSASPVALYSWSGAQALKSNVLGVVASNDSGFDFASMAAATASNFDTSLGWQTTDADSMTNTMTGSSTIIAGAFTSIPSAALNDYEEGTAGTAKFKVGIFADGSTVAKYAVGVNNSFGPWRSFDNQTEVTYELIVPVVGNSPSVGSTVNFWLALK